MMSVQFFFFGISRRAARFSAIGVFVSAPLGHVCEKPSFVDELLLHVSSVKLSGMCIILQHFSFIYT